MARGEFSGMTVFQFQTPEDHKQTTLLLVEQGLTLADVTRAFGRLFLHDDTVRGKVVALAKKSRAIKQRSV